MKSLIIPNLEKEGKSQKRLHVYKQILSTLGGYAGPPHEFVAKVEDVYEKRADELDRAVHGGVFELAIGETLAQAGARPLYHQASLHHVHYTTFDWFLYNPQAPVAVSCKTKSRDREKQAVLEANMLRGIYPLATSYLVVIEPIKNTDHKQRMKTWGVDKYVVATSSDYDQVVGEIAAQKYEEAVPVCPIENHSLLIK